MRLWDTNKEVDDINIRVLNSKKLSGYVSEVIDTYT